VEAVQAAVQSRLASGQSLSQQAIGKVVGVSPTGLSYYPRVKELLQQVIEMRLHDIAEKRQKYEAELVEQVLAAESLLREREQGITQTAIGKVIGKTPDALKRYPRVKATLLSN